MAENDPDPNTFWASLTWIISTNEQAREIAKRCRSYDHLTDTLTKLGLMLEEHDQENARKKHLHDLHAGYLRVGMRGAAIAFALATSIPTLREIGRWAGWWP